MTEAELLEHAAAAGAGFLVLVPSPLLIPRVRGAGGTGGRRITAGVAVDAAGDAAFAVLVEGHGQAGSPQLLASALACAHAFGDELRRARRDGLDSSPPPQPTSAAALLAAGVAVLG